jgi:NAD-dependent SIR2 family protein deacetylase
MHCLDRRSNLLRVYTQNIDAMEKTAGILSFGVPTLSQIGEPDCPRCIPLLGRLDQMTCTLSHHVVPSATFLNQSPSDGLPICTTCKPYTHHGYHGIRRPNIVVCKEEQPNLNSILDHDKNLVDVVLAVGIHPLPYCDHPNIIKQFVQAVQSKSQPEVPSSILIDLDTSNLEKTGVHNQFQISLALDLQDFFGHIIVAAYQDAYHNPASNTMVVPRKLGLMDFSMKHSNNIEEEEEDHDGDGDKLLLALQPWYFPDS